MAISAITICSNALILLGHTPIASFDDGDTGSMLSSNLYEMTYKAMLTDTLWHFATRSELLAKTTEKPTNGYSNKFRLPSDLLYVVKASHMPYEIYGKELYANANSVTIEMIYAIDEVNLPVYFIKALEYNLASLFAIPLTGNTSRADYYRGLYEREIKKARRADASQRPGYQLGSNRYIDVRST